MHEFQISRALSIFSYLAQTSFTARNSIFSSICTTCVLAFARLVKMNDLDMNDLFEPRFQGYRCHRGSSLLTLINETLIDHPQSGQNCTKDLM